MTNPATPNSVSARVIDYVVRLSRIKRIGLAALFALAVTLSITPIVDNIYLEHFFDPNTRVLPALISTVVGLAFYVLGWRLIIGYVGETPTPRPAILWYVIVGAAACVVVALLVVFGAITGTME